jgi:hypothetical protein
MLPWFLANKYFQIRSMPADKYITSTCTIYKGAIIKDSARIFESDGDLPAFLLSAYQHFKFNYPKFYKMDNLSKLGWLAAEILLKDCFQKGNYTPEETGVILANANSSLDDDQKYSDSIKDTASPSLFVYTLPNIVIGEICIRNHFKGEQAFFIQDAFDADFMERQVSYLLDKNMLQACLCGWVDVFEQDYKAVLFLVEKKKNESAQLFLAKNMNAIFTNY